MKKRRHKKLKRILHCARVLDSAVCHHRPHVQSQALPTSVWACWVGSALHYWRCILTLPVPEGHLSGQCQACLPSSTSSPSLCDTQLSSQHYCCPVMPLTLYSAECPRSLSFSPMDNPPLVPNTSLVVGHSLVVGIAVTLLVDPRDGSESLCHLKYLVTHILISQPTVTS